MTPVEGTHGKFSAGIDAYEAGFDWIARHLRSFVSLNCVLFSMWFVFQLMIVFLSIHFDSYLCFWLSTFFFNALLAFPLWEALNIFKYRFLAKNAANGPNFLLLFRCLVANAMFVFLCCCGYLFFFFPGIYIHSRLLIYLPIIIDDPNNGSLASLKKAWHLSQGRFLTMYSLWIATVVLTPFACLPLGLGFVLEKPVKALAKQIVFEEITKMT